MNGYERASKEIIPAVRVMIARELKERYNLREEDIAERLEVAQAAISKYLSGKYSERMQRVIDQIDRSRIDKYMPAILKGERFSVNSCICSVCKTLNDFGCEFSYSGKY